MLVRFARYDWAPPAPNHTSPHIPAHPASSWRPSPEPLDITHMTHTFGRFEWYACRVFEGLFFCTQQPPGAAGSIHAGDGAPQGVDRPPIRRGGAVAKHQASQHGAGLCVQPPGAQLGEPTSSHCPPTTTKRRPCQARSYERRLCKHADAACQQRGTITTCGACHIHCSITAPVDRIKQRHHVPCL